MENKMGNHWLPINKKKLFTADPVIGIGNDIENANIIAFERALEKVQNKLSLPEYHGPEHFEETEENEVFQENHADIINECLPNPHNSTEINRKQNTLNDMWRKQQNSIVTFNLGNEKKLKSESTIINSLQPKVKSRSLSTMKQMTLDKYSFQGNATKSLKPSCSIMIACSNNMSIDNKKYSHQKVLYMENSTNLQDLGNACYFSIPNLSTSILSPWDERIVPNTLVLPILMSKKRGTVASSTKLCINERDLGEQSTNSVSLYSDLVENDSLDLDIDAAMQKYEGSAELHPTSEDVAVQTHLHNVHFCNCLHYHMCEQFRGLGNDRCVEKREIAALDLDTLQHLHKRNTGAHTLPDRRSLHIKKNAVVMKTMDVTNKQTQTLQEVCDSEIAIFSNSKRENIACTFTEHDGTLCFDKSLPLEQFVPDLKDPENALEKTVDDVTEKSNNREVPCFENNQLEENVLTKAFLMAADGGKNYEKETYKLNTSMEKNVKYLSDEFFMNNEDSNISGKIFNISNNWDKNNFILDESRNMKGPLINTLHDDDQVEYVPDVINYAELPMIAKPSDEIEGVKMRTKKCSSEVKADIRLSGNTPSGKNIVIKDASLDAYKGISSSYVDCSKFERHLVSPEEVFTTDGCSEIDHTTCNDVDQNVPDTSNRQIVECQPNDKDYQEAPVSWNSAFQWKGSNAVVQLANSPEPPGQQHYEEPPVLQAALQKRRRIGLSKRDKTVSLHPKRYKNF